MKIRAKRGIHTHVLDESDNRWITPDGVYPVIGIETDSYRIINDRGDPISYGKYLFEIVDPSIPDSWVRIDVPPDEYFIQPAEMSDLFFWERFHDGDPDARARLQQYLDRVGEAGE